MINKTYEIIDYIEKSDIKKRLDYIKEKISSNEDSKKLINKFNEAKELYEKYNYKDDFIKAKINMLKDPLIKEYINLQNKVNLLTIQINNRINNITKGITNKK